MINYFINYDKFAKDFTLIKNNNLNLRLTTINNLYTD